MNRQNGNTRSFDIVGGEFGSFVISTVLSFAVVCLCVASSGDFQHWFVLPLLLCGSIAGTDAIEWLRGHSPIFHPVGLMGLIIVYFCFISPLLLILWDYRIPFLTIQPEDYRAWIGGMAVLNSLGLTAYRYSRLKAEKSALFRPGRIWVIDIVRFRYVAAVFLLGSLIAQITVYAKFGGIAGYFALYQSSLSGDVGSYKGLGWLLAIAEVFPVLAVISTTVLLERRRSAGFAVFILTSFFVLELFFGGLRGSRSNVIWPLFWACGVVHCFIRPFKRVNIICAVPALLLFMYVYGFYKSLGPAGMDALSDPSSRAEIIRETGRSSAVLLLSDFSRSDVQAFALFKLVGRAGEYHLAWGESYLGAIALLIPKTIWPGRPATKIRWTTEAEYGIEDTDPEIFFSSRVYGLAGEAMLNFGPWIVPGIYGLAGLVVGWVAAWARSLCPADSRLLLYPLAILFCFWLVLNDSDVLFFSFLKYGFLPIAMVFLGSNRKRLVTP